MQALSNPAGQETPPHCSTVSQATGTFSVTRWQAQAPSTQAGPKPSGQSEEHSAAFVQEVTTAAGAQAQAPSMQAATSFSPQAAADAQSAGVVQEIVVTSVERQRQTFSSGSQNGEAPSGQAASAQPASLKHVPP